MLQWHLANLEYANGTRLSNLSLPFWDSDDRYDLAGGHYMVRDGFSGVCAGMAARLGGALRLGLAVQQVERREDGVTVRVRPTEAGRVALTEALEADVVVMTVPLGVLKTGAIAFEPPLPAAKQAAIEGLGFGLLNKVVVTFKTVFWGDEVRPPTRHRSSLAMGGEVIFMRPCIFY